MKRRSVIIAALAAPLAALLRLRQRSKPATISSGPVTVELPPASNCVPGSTVTVKADDWAPVIVQASGGKFKFPRREGDPIRDEDIAWFKASGGDWEKIDQ